MNGGVTPSARRARAPYALGAPDHRDAARDAPAFAAAHAPARPRAPRPTHARPRPSLGHTSPSSVRRAAFDAAALSFASFARWRDISSKPGGHASSVRGEP